jgi:hypothetical protein
VGSNILLGANEDAIADNFSSAIALSNEPALF